MNIITDTSRAYHTPCEIQSAVIDVSFTAWAMMAVVIVISVVVVLVVVILVGSITGTVVLL